MRPWQADEDIVFFFRWKVLIRHKIPKEYKYTRQIKSGGGKKSPSSRAWLGLLEHACQISTTYLQKTAWTSDAF